MRTKEIKLERPPFYNDTIAMLTEEEKNCLFALINEYIHTRVEPPKKDRIGAVKYVWAVFRMDADEQLRKIETNQQRNNPEYMKWRKQVFTRDNFTCQICGAVGGSLNAHHIMPFAKYPALRYKIENGVTLCEKCHRAVHRERGYK